MFKRNDLHEVIGLAKAWFNDPFGLFIQFLSAYFEQEHRNNREK